MPVDAITVVSLAAIVVMLYALWQVIRLKRQIPGGVVGRSWRILFALGVCLSNAIPGITQTRPPEAKLRVASVFNGLRH